MSNPQMVTANPTMVTMEPHVSLEAAVRYATALESFNSGAIQFMRDLRTIAPMLTFQELEEFAHRLQDYRDAHRNPERSVSQARHEVLELAREKGISVDTSSNFYSMLYHFSFNAGVLARAQSEALAERKQFSA